KKLAIVSIRKVVTRALRATSEEGVAQTSETDSGRPPDMIKDPSGRQVNKENSLVTHRFTTTAELSALLDRHFPQADVLVMAAAVADYRPVVRHESKLPRRQEKIAIELEPTEDLVARCAAAKRTGQRIIGFALEPDELDARAAEKLAR